MFFCRKLSDITHFSSTLQYLQSSVQKSKSNQIEFLNLSISSKAIKLSVHTECEALWLVVSVSSGLWDLELTPPTLLLYEKGQNWNDLSFKTPSHCLHLPSVSVKGRQMMDSEVNRGSSALWLVRSCCVHVFQLVCSSSVSVITRLSVVKQKPFVYLWIKVSIHHKLLC